MLRPFVAAAKQLCCCGRLSVGSNAPIRMAEVPLPPDLTNPLCLSAAATTEERKAALRTASLRWHPDKFHGKYGRRVAESDHDALKAKVTEVFQAINAQREKS